MLTPPGIAIFAQILPADQRELHTTCLVRLR